MQSPFWDAQPLQNPPLCSNSTSRSAIPRFLHFYANFSADLFAAAVEVGGGCCVILANASGPGLGIPKSPVGSAALPPLLPPVPPRPGGLKPPPMPCILYQKHFSEKDPKTDFNQDNEKLCSKTTLSQPSIFGQTWGPCRLRSQTCRGNVLRRKLNRKYGRRKGTFSAPFLSIRIRPLEFFFSATRWVAHAGSGHSMSGGNKVTVVDPDSVGWASFPQTQIHIHFNQM
jgi:hypothetical protein